MTLFVLNDVFEGGSCVDSSLLSSAYNTEKGNYTVHIIRNILSLSLSLSLVMYNYLFFDRVYKYSRFTNLVTYYFPAVPSVSVLFVLIEDNG